MPVESVIPPRDDAPLTLTTLGQFTLLDPAGTPLLGPGKPLALLAYLACSPGRTASREHLIDLLWADADPDRARHALRQALWQLRHAVGDGCLTGREEIALGCDLRVDRNRFLAAIETGDLEAALALYGGPFLAAFASPGGAGFEHWADAEREGLEAAFHRAAELHARRLLAAGQPREVIVLARRVIEAEPHGQAGRRLLIEAHLAAGDTISAVAEAEALRRWADGEEIDLEPASRTWIDRATQRSPSAVAMPGQSGIAVTALAADLVGREAEFAAILGAWTAASGGALQHLHLVAPAGLGKTRLLLDIEARLRSTGARVRYVRAHPGDRELAGALASELARALVTLPGAKAIAPDVAGTLVALDPALAGTYQAKADPSTGTEAVRRRVLALAELIRAVADEGPLALLIDDVHWADVGSVDILSAVLTRVGNERLMVISATRPTSDQQLRSDARTTLRLAPLTPAQIGALLESIATFDQIATAQDIAAQLHVATGGNPLQILELLALATERRDLTIASGCWQVAAHDPPRPLFTARDGIRQRVARLGPDSRRVLSAMALAGSPISEAVLATATRLDPAAVGEQLGSLERLGFVVSRTAGWEVVHDEIAAEAADVEPERALELHRQLGRALAERPGATATDINRAARHQFLADDVPALARSVEQLHRLARARGERPELSRLTTTLLGPNAPPRMERAVRAALPLRLRVASSRLGWVAAAMVVLVAVVGWQRAVTADTARRTAARSAVFEVLWEGVDDTLVHAARVTIDPQTWDPEDPPSFGAETVLETSWVNWGMSHQYFASGDSLIGSTPATPRISGSQDLVMTGKAGPRLLVPAPRDDVAPRLSPDGRGVFFLTTRWAPEAEDDYDIAYLRFGDSVPTPIISSRDHQTDAIPFADGTRIGYVEFPRMDGTPSLCEADFDGGRHRCVRLRGYSGANLLGITPAGGRVLVVSEAGSAGGRLVRVDSLGAPPQLLSPLAVRTAKLHATTGAILCLCSDPATGNFRLRIEWADGRAGAWLHDPPGPSILALEAVQAPGRAPFLDSLTIERPGSIMIGTTHRFTVGGRDTSGTPIPVPPSSLRWRIVSGTGMLDSLTGAFLAVDSRPVRIEVSAGGWRAAVLDFTPEPPSGTELLSEDWSTGIDTARWRPFGTPRPVIRRHGAEFTLDPNGDRSYHSGVYSTTGWELGAGLTLDAEFRTPVTANVSQMLVITFKAVAEGPRLAAWDHTSGYPPGDSNAGLGSCGVYRPGGEGGEAHRRLTFVAATASQPIQLNWPRADTTRHLARIRLFPDGTCGVAIDGIPYWRSAFRITTDFPFRIWLTDQSEGTTFEVGQLTLWQGDPGGVDWGLLDRPSGTDSSGEGR